LLLWIDVLQGEQFIRQANVNPEYGDVLAGKRKKSNRLPALKVEEASSLWPAARCRFHLLENFAFSAFLRG
jgi:hypothetical protein